MGTFAIAFPAIQLNEKVTGIFYVINFQSFFLPLHNRKCFKIWFVLSNIKTEYVFSSPCAVLMRRKRKQRRLCKATCIHIYDGEMGKQNTRLYHNRQLLVSSADLKKVVISTQITTFTSRHFICFRHMQQKFISIYGQLCSTNSWKKNIFLTLHV